MRSYECFVTLIDVLFLSVNSHVLVYQVFLNTHSHNTYMTEHAFTSSFSFFKFVFLFRVPVRCVCQPFFFYHKIIAVSYGREGEEQGKLLEFIFWVAALCLVCFARVFFVEVAAVIPSASGVWRSLWLLLAQTSPLGI